MFTDLNFVGSPGAGKSTMIVIHGDRIALVGNDIQFPRGLCINAGSITRPWSVWRRAYGIVIDRNRIHDCGSSITPDSSGVHGIYLSQHDRRPHHEQLHLRQRKSRHPTVAGR